MIAVKLYRGDTWTRAWEIKDASGNPVDLSGATARLHVRDGQGNLVMSASTSDGRLTIQPTAGRIDLLVPKEATVIAPGNYRFDIEVTYPSGRRTTYEQAVLVVLEDVTHD